MSSRGAKLFVAVALVALVVFVVWRLMKSAPMGARIVSSPTTIAPKSTGQSKQSTSTQPAVDPSLPSPAVLQLNSPTSTIAADLQIVADVLEAFRTNFPTQGNPVGENREITAALTGDNALHIAFVPRNHPAIDARGALCDRWGTPFFFHQLSGTQMEIRSAGPDRKMWTEDDNLLSPIGR